MHWDQTLLSETSEAKPYISKLDMPKHAHTLDLLTCVNE